MRVLHVFTRFNAGGPAQMALDIFPLLKEQGVELLIATGKTTPPEVPWEEKARDRGLAVVQIPGLGKSDGTLAGYRNLSRLLAEWRPDIVHTNMARAGVLGRLAAFRRRVPGRVHTFHGHLFTGYFKPWQTWAIRQIERVMAILSTRLVAVAPRVKDDLITLGIARANKFSVLVPALDLEPFCTRERKPREGDRPVVGWVGRMVPVKDPGLLGRIAKNLPEARFVAVGGGALLPEMEINHPQVEWLGHCADMPGFYAGLDLLVMTSKNEGLPLTIIEAMAAGVPVISTAVGGVGDIVTDGENGLLTPDRSPLALGQAIRRVLGDRDLAKGLVRAGRERAQVYSAVRAAADLVTFYKTLI